MRLPDSGCRPKKPGELCYREKTDAKILTTKRGIDILNGYSRDWGSEGWDIGIVTACSQVNLGGKTLCPWKPQEPGLQVKVGAIRKGTCEMQKAWREACRCCKKIITILLFPFNNFFFFMFSIS
ncbi:MAG: hypothetical protein ACOX7X_12365 [Methanosarcina flavescens]|jgi:hypothetical protein|uniref:Uncharacterized protein n=1 Tax=Methanosarcina flavescens TaxID=1715806 RepID=A0A7K4AW18_9EURY|nr:hypothetical protein [Methanosarcina flavescens]NLK32899.1 hypothetical protein [Methanosarcina flavescens]